VEARSVEEVVERSVEEVVERGDIWMMCGEGLSDIVWGEGLLYAPQYVGLTVHDLILLDSKELCSIFFVNIFILNIIIRINQ